MINGLNHITIAVSDIDESLSFYTQVLGCHGHAVWDSGAYLSVGEIWICLSLDSPAPSNDYCHIAWSVEQSDFPFLCEKVLSSGARQWKANKSEGESLYFLDPDGHKLEIHVGSLEQRLASLKNKPYKGLRWL